MNKLMTKQFFQWASKQKIPDNELTAALTELQYGNFEANLGGHIYKKRIRFEGQGKSGSGRTIKGAGVTDLMNCKRSASSTLLKFPV